MCDLSIQKQTVTVKPDQKHPHSSAAYTKKTGTFTFKRYAFVPYQYCILVVSRYILYISTV